MSDHPTERIARIVLDEGTIISRTPEIEHERRVAIADLIEDNEFAPVEFQKGPYYLFLSVADNRLSMQLCEHVSENEQGNEVGSFVLPLTPFRRVIKDYFMICESYFEAIKHGDVTKIEAIDMGRRGIHNEGSEVLASLLQDRVAMDFETARRLFTLICVLHIK